MNDDREGWDEDVLNDIFNARDRELIKRIPMSLHLQHDSWFWNLEQTGLFIVKSCYRRLVGEQNGPHEVLWRKLRSLDLPRKVTNFIWRTCRDMVPTAAALAAKHVQKNMICSWCMLADEMIEHVLFGCSFSQGVWSRVGIQEISHERCQRPVKEVLCSLGSTFTKKIYPG
ncbi:uncharacterized protein LOC141673685 [Apium graveolens]|uniref:uncharacterized protein LOC141673685 n=1 Tax=Apium graveolens TaxID=4045 RepID=UPI003D79B6FD